MCGIAGIVSAEPRDLGPFLSSMLRVQQHRGPDGAGIVVGQRCQRRESLDRIEFNNQVGTAGLGHVRLAITGSAEGIQPFASADGRLHLLHNGEIYNYRQLRSDLELRGHRFATATDTEVIVHLYEEHGADCVQALRGMFAFAIWDGPRRRLQPLVKATAADAHPLVGVCNDPETVTGALAAAGFAQVELETIGNLARAWGRRLPTFAVGLAGDVIAQGSPSRRSTILASAVKPAGVSGR